MSSKGRKPVDQARHKIMMKLSSVDEESHALQELMSNIIKEILGPTEWAKSLLKEKSTKKFMSEFPRINQVLEGCLDQLLLLRNALVAFENAESSDSSDNEFSSNKGEITPLEDSASKSGNDEVKPGSSEKEVAISRIEIDLSEDVPGNAVLEEKKKQPQSRYPQNFKASLHVPAKQSKTLLPNQHKKGSDTQKDDSNVVHALESKDQDNSLHTSSNSGNLKNDSKNLVNFPKEKFAASSSPIASQKEKKIEVIVISSDSDSSLSSKSVKLTEPVKKKTYSQSRGRERLPAREKNSSVKAVPSSSKQKDQSSAFQDRVTKSETNERKPRNARVKKECKEMAAANTIEKVKQERSPTLPRMPRKPGSVVKWKQLSQGSAPPPYPWKAQSPMPVIITEVINPWEIYVQPINSDFDEMMEEMCLQFAMEAKQGYKGGINHIPEVGTYCCAKSPVDHIWYRAEVKGIRHLEAAVDTSGNESDSLMSMDDPFLACVEVSVFFIDDGSTAKVPLNHIRPLTENLKRVPCQTVRCMLGGICPQRIGDFLDVIEMEKRWSVEATEWLSNMAKSENMWVGYLVSHVQRGKQCTIIDLYTAAGYDFSTESDSCPPVEQNLAYMMLQVGCASLNIFMPSHLEEQQNEIRQLLGDNIRPDFDTKPLQKPSGRSCAVEPACDAQVTGQGHLLEAKIKEEAAQERSPLACAIKSETFTYKNKYKVKPLGDLVGESFIQVLVSIVVSPDLFYVHLVTPDVVRFDDLMENLQRFYGEMKGLPSMVHGRLEIGSAVVSNCAEDKNWCRGIIVAEKDEGGKRQFEVFHLDFGSRQWTLLEDIRPVASRFFELPVETISCKLTGIQPCYQGKEGSEGSLIQETPGKETREQPLYRASGDEDTAIMAKATGVNQRKEWPNKATKEFCQLAVQGQPLFISIEESQRQEVASRRAYSFKEEPLPVFLYDTNGETDVLINDELVKRGVAQCRQEREEKCMRQASNQTTDSAASPLSPTAPNNLDQWNPMEEEYLSGKNSYAINVDDPAVITMGYEEPRREICHYFLSKKGCSRGKYCIYEHARPEDAPSTLKEVYCERLANVTRLPDPGTWVLVQVTSFFDPTHFWARFLFGTRPLTEIIEEASGFSSNVENEADELDLLQRKLNEHCATVPFRNRELTLYAIGELVAARYSIDGAWYRAKIIEVLTIENNASFKVFFVDFGNSDTVSEEDTRLLDPQFLNLEFQAVECFLFNCRLSESVIQDTVKMERGNKCFDDMVSEKVLTAKVMSRAGNKTLVLDLYHSTDQTVVCLRDCLIETGCVEEAVNSKQNPWDLSGAIAMNPKIIHMLPG